MAFSPRAFASTSLAFQARCSTNVPVIDGYLGSAEWSDATDYRFNLSGPTDVETWAYFKHNSTYIYIGLVVWQLLDNTVDQFTIFFDEGDDGGYGSGTHDGVLKNNQEDLKKCSSQSGGVVLSDGCYKGSSYAAYTVEIDFDADCVHENDHFTSSSEIEYWEGLAWVDDHWECEFAIPFVGNDGGASDVSDLVCTQIDTIGIKIQYFTQPSANNFYYPAGSQSQIETYTTLSFPPPTIESCHVSYMWEDVFETDEAIYIAGSGFSPSDVGYHDLYVMSDTTWIDGMDIPSRIASTTDNIYVLPTGVIPGSVIWGPPLTPGKYDILVDLNGNGIYDAKIDALDDNDVEITAGVQVIPEFPSLLILPLFMIATLLAVIVYKRKHAI
jgi:hypothetical protein